MYAALFYFIFWLRWIFLAALGLVAPLACGIRHIHVPCTGRQMLPRWTTREVPFVLFLNIIAY